MEAKDRIESGDLELYVYGVLPENEMIQISKELEQSELLRKEVELIEKSVLTFSETLSPGVKPSHFVNLYQSIKEKEVPVRSLDKKPNWVSYIGWAASVVLIVSLWYANNELSEAQDAIQVVQQEKTSLNFELSEKENLLDVSQELVAFLSADGVLRVPLPANDAVAPEAFAQVFYNEITGKAIIDISGLPTPPQGMVYQAWSLLLDPLTPRSIGLLEEGEASFQLISLSNIPVSEAFGITLEPAGGSESPNLDQLYVLGTV